MGIISRTDTSDYVASLLKRHENSKLQHRDRHCHRRKDL